VERMSSWLRSSVAFVSALRVVLVSQRLNPLTGVCVCVCVCVSVVALRA
jgi:hypothetical protein